LAVNLVLELLLGKQIKCRLLARICLDLVIVLLVEHVKVILGEVVPLKMSLILHFNNVAFSFLLLMKQTRTLLKVKFLLEIILKLFLVWKVYL
jgi:hypothetical protein